jgi:hypothetical protein
MKALLSCPFNSISDRPASHRSSQGVIYADMIRQAGVDLDVNFGGKIEDYNQYETLYVYHGNDWFGSLNLFGGLQAYSNVANVKAFSQFKGRVISLGCDFPPYHDMLIERILKAKENNKEIQPEWLEVDMENLKIMYIHSPTVKFPHITNKIVIGDSHSICMYRPGWMINSIPFKTLNGVINDGIENCIPFKSPTIESVECYFGNIDIRHHLCRISDDHVQNTKDLVKRYVEAVESLPVDDVSIYEPLLIENPSRKLPKTGYYKGKPFTGTWEQRDECRRVFADEVERISTRAKLIRWTDYLANDLGELDFAKMEKPQSVHLSREFYPHWTGIDPASTPIIENNSLDSFFL